MEEIVMSQTTEKKRTTSDINNWEHRFGIFYKNDEEVMCVLCGMTFTCIQTDNFQHHYVTNHSAEFDKFGIGTPERNHEIAILKAKYFDSPNSSARKKLVNDDDITKNELSFKFAYEIAKKKRPLSDCKIIQSIVKICVNCMFTGTELEERTKKFVEDIPLSHQTVIRRIELLDEDMTKQLDCDIESCFCYSLQLNESTDITNINIQVLIHIRMVFNDLTVKEELYAMVPLNYESDTENVYDEVIKRIKLLPLDKLVSLTCCSSDLIDHLHKIPQLQNPLSNQIRNFINMGLMRNFLNTPFEKEIDTKVLFDAFFKFSPHSDECALLNEIVTLQKDDTLLGTMITNKNSLWKFVAQDNQLSLKYPELLRIYKEICSFFTSSDVRKSKNPYRMKDIMCDPSNLLTDKDLENIMKISTNTYKPDIKKLSKSLQNSITDDK